MLSPSIGRDGLKSQERLAESVQVIKYPPSVSLALPPVGVQSTAEQLLHTTTLWEWLNTVVLHKSIYRSACRGQIITCD